jgi:hypothetical protein
MASLLLYSDALSELQRAGEAMVGVDGMIDAARPLATMSTPRAFIRALCAKMLGDPPVMPPDDLTIVCLRRN